MSYMEEIYQKAVRNHPEEAEYHRAVAEVFTSVRPVVDLHEKRFREAALLERLAEPERSISFRVPWVDDSGQVRVNRGWRIQFSSALGPYKGGLRFNLSVNQGNLKQAAFEQTLKNALTGFHVGGAKGGSDFDRRGKSDREVMAFCQSFMRELYRHTGKTGDILTADFGAGIAEIGYLFGEYRKLTGAHNGAITGKGLSFGGIRVRPQAAGYGLVYILEAMLRQSGMGLEGKTAVVSGSGKMAIHAAEKLMQLGAKVVALSDENGFLYDENGIRLDVVRRIKMVVRESFTGSIRGYTAEVPGSVYITSSAFFCTEKNRIWSIPCDIALPCAGRGEMCAGDVKLLAANGCIAVAEGAINPLTDGATDRMKKSGILYMPGKAANIGGVVVSNLEMCQNKGKRIWSLDVADTELHRTMGIVFRECAEAAERYGMPGDYLAGANITAFEKVAEAMLSQGCV